MRRFWTAAEDKAIRKRYLTESAAAIAADLDRTTGAIYQRANTLGLSRPRQCVTDDQIRDALQQYHPLGWSDAEIAAAMLKQHDTIVDRHRIGRLRQTLNLASNKGSAHHRRRVAAKTREQLAAAGLPTIGHLRVEAYNQWKRSLGWPEDLTVRAVQALELFYRRGPMTRLQLCSAMGIVPRCRTDPKSNAKGGTVMAELMRADLLFCLPRAVRLGGQGQNLTLYMLNPGVEPDASQRQPQNCGR